MLKRVLFISYFFPPLGGVKVQRALKFVEYLPSFAWMPTVLSVRNADHDYYDYDLINEIPSRVRVIRTYSFEPSKLYKFLRACYDTFRDFSKLKRVKKTDLCGIKSQSLALKLNNFIFIPDNKIGWVPFALYKILSFFRANDFDLIYSTSPVFTSHLLGLAAKLAFKKPWVVDLRDLWVLNPYLRPPTKLHSKISRLIESNTFRKADKIVTVAEELRQDLIENYPEISPEKFVVIPNGYDQADFESESEPKRNKFSIGYIGSLYLFSGRTPHYFLLALGELFKQFPQLEKEMDVTFVGPLDRQNRKIFESILFRYNLKKMVQQIGPVSHREAIKYMKSFSLLLLIVGKKTEKHKSRQDHPYDRTSVTGKLFEYLASGKPILALTAEGPVKRIIQQSNAGFVVEPEDIEAIKKEILSCYRLHKENKLKAQTKREMVARYERKNLTGKLARIFDELATKES